MSEHEHLSPVDTAWLRLDQDANTADIVALISFDEPVEPDAIRETVQARFCQFPEFVRRIVDPGPPRMPYWEDFDFDIDEHVRVEHLDDGTTEELHRFVSLVLTRKLRPNRPLWQMWVVQNVEGGSALVVKLHHCLGDGFAMVGVLLTLCDEDLLTPDKDDEQPRPSLGAQLWDGVVDVVRHPDHAITAAKNSARAAASLGELLMLPFDTPTSLRGTLTGVRRAAWSHGIPLERFKQIARTTDGTVNDVLLTVLSGALRDVLIGRGDDVDDAEIRALVPVNLRPLDRMGKELGNRFGLVFLDVPISCSSREERHAAIKSSMQALKRSPQAVVAFGVLGAIGVAPEVVEHLALDIFSQKASLVVTNVPGPSERLHIAGHEIDHLMFWVPHPTIFGLGISLLSYAGDVRIGVRSDTGVLDDPQILVEAFEAELDAMEIESVGAPEAPGSPSA